MSATLTDREAEMIIRIAEDEYGEEPEDVRWFDIICKTLNDSRVIGDLTKKGLANSNHFGPRNEWTIHLTPNGVIEYRGLRP